MYKQVKKEAQTIHCLMFFSAPFPREKVGEAQKLNSEKCVFYSERKKNLHLPFLGANPKSLSI